MSDEFSTVYPYSCEEARSRDQIFLWRESHRENIACKNAIEEAIRRDFDGMHLKAECARSVIDQYGFKRVQRVLAKSAYIPPDKNSLTDHNLEYVAESHPAVLDGFINQYRRAYQELGLFGPGQCEPGSEKLSYEGRVLVLSPDILKESCWSRQDQLWLATGGFGCAPNSSGRAVFATCLNDGEKARWNRADFTGVLRERLLPDWAREKFSELQEQQPSEGMGGMKME